MLQAQRHIPGAHTRNHLHAGLLQAVEVNIPQPGHVTTVSVLVVNRDHGCVVVSVRARQGQAETARVLHQQQLQRAAVHVQGLTATEGGGNLRQLRDELIFVELLAHDGAGQCHSASRVEDVVNAVEVDFADSLHTRQVEGCGGAGERGQGNVCLGQGCLRDGAAAHLIIRGEVRAQGLIQAVVLDGHARLHVLSEGADARVLTVEHHSAGRCGGDGRQHAAGRVNLTEAVQLVTQNVQQQSVIGLDGLHEVHGVRLVQLKHSDISVKLAAEGHLAQQCRSDTAHKVRTGAVSENLQTLSFKELHSHLRGGGLTVRAGDNNHAVGQLRELFSDEVGVQFFHDKAGEGGAAAAKLSRGAYALAEKTNEGFGHAYHFSTRTPAAEWSARLVRSCRTRRGLVRPGLGAAVQAPGVWSGGGFRTANPAPSPA